MTPPLSYLALRAAEFCTHVALHEAGHAIVGRFYGVRADTCLVIEESSLSGCTEYHGELTEQQFRIVSLAGAIATAVWQRPDVTAEQLIMDDWMPTPRDAKDAGEFVADDLAECLQIVRSHWADVEAEAALLLQALLGTHK